MMSIKFATSSLVFSLFLGGCAEQAAGISKNNASDPTEIRVSSSSTTGRGERQFTAYLTGYTFWDNTPAGSAAIARPVVHREAGGTGTYSDPVTIAVGHTIYDGKQTLDYPAGTRFYITRLRKYAIVEDVCGDGHNPQDGPCHSGYKGHPWLDLYLGGAQMSAKASDACARRITALQPIVINPRPGYPVHEGEVASSGCALF